jgi:hypothetical protein
MITGTLVHSLLCARIISFVYIVVVANMLGFEPALSKGVGL